jgi:hypothetical protein
VKRDDGGNKNYCALLTGRAEERKRVRNPLKTRQVRREDVDETRQMHVWNGLDGEVGGAASGERC